MIIPPDKYNNKKLMEFLAAQTSAHISWGGNFADALADRLKNGKELIGSKLPWANTHESLRFAPGQISIWAGMNGHKKSMLLGQVIMWIAKEERVGVSSFEMPVIDTMGRMVSQAAGCMPAVSFGRRWAAWSDERMCFYDKLDTVPSEVVLGSIFYMAKEMGCKHIVIDSLTKCGLPSGDRDAEKKFIDILAATAKAFQIHIHLVAHVRKPPQGGESYIPTKFDVRGAGELTDLVDNVLIVWMDKKKEMLRQKMQQKGLTDEETEYMKRPDQRLICCKQRHGEWEGTIALWFDKKSLQFIPNDSGRPLPFDISELRAVS